MKEKKHIISYNYFFQLLLFTIMENETTKILGLDQNSSKENVNESHKTKDEKKVVTSKKSHIANFAAQTGATAMGQLLEQGLQ